jgi:excisionase family DNA binding protein
MIGNKFWDVEQLAEYLGVGKTWIYERTRENGAETIPHIKLGKYVRFNPESEAFQTWLKSHEKQPCAQ